MSCVLKLLVCGCNILLNLNISSVNMVSVLGRGTSPLKT